LVRQQDDRAIPVIEKARGRFPPNYVDHIVCRIAIGRIRKKRLEGYLPMEALEIQLPSDRIMSALLHEKPSERDTLQERTQRLTSSRVRQLTFPPAFRARSMARRRLNWGLNFWGT
jgi:hypothetical protein